jgi:MGT family glycosyltransferase
VANVYFFNGSDHGHVNPTLGLVAELVRRGDDVTYFSGDTFRAAIQRTGATFRAYQAGPPPPEKISGAEHYVAFLLDYSALLLPTLIEQAKVDKPEYIIFDMQRLWGWHLAQLLKVPAICSSPSFALTEPVLGALVPDILRALANDEPAPAVQPFVDRYMRTATALSVRYGIDSPSILQAISMTGDITLVFTTSRIHPATHLLDPTIYLVGPSFQARSEASDDFPLALLEDRQVVFISLGTIFNERVDFYRNCVQAFADADYRVVMAIGHKLAIDALGPIPSNFIVRNVVPQLEVLKRTDVFVTHGGMGSVHEALAFGVPMVVFPQMIEQSLVAGRVAALGAGMQLTQHGPDLGLVSTAIVDAATLRNAADRVLQTPSFANRARELGTEFRADTPAYAADIIQQHVHRRAARKMGIDAGKGAHSLAGRFDDLVE